MYAATTCHASLRLKVGSGCRNSVGCGGIPVFGQIRSAKSGGYRSWEVRPQAPQANCDHNTAQSTEKECRCAIARVHQVAPASGTAAGQFTPGSDLQEMGWGKTFGDPYFCFGEPLQLGSEMQNYLFRTVELLCYPRALLRKKSGDDFHRFCSHRSNF